MAKNSAVRPWLAAVLTLLVTGLGHLYLREWFRAAAWFLLVVLGGIIFVPERVFEAPHTAQIQEVAPVLFVAFLAVVDAYVQARRHNRTVAIESEDRCGHCGRVIDPELSFCQWCTTPRQPTTGLEGVDQ